MWCLLVPNWLTVETPKFIWHNFFLFLIITEKLTSVKMASYLCTCRYSTDNFGKIKTDVAIHWDSSFNLRLSDKWIQFLGEGSGLYFFLETNSFGLLFTHSTEEVISCFQQKNFQLISQFMHILITGITNTFEPQ